MTERTRMLSPGRRRALVTVVATFWLMPIAGLVVGVETGLGAPLGALLGALTMALLIGLAWLVLGVVAMRRELRHGSDSSS